MKTRRKFSRGPEPFDVHVGARIRQKRILLGLSQEKIADALGITFQQVQKYERGANRVSASRLLHIANLLDVDLNWFAEEFEPRGADLVSLDIQGDLGASDPLQRKDVLRLARHYVQCTEPDQETIQAVVKGFAGHGQELAASASLTIAAE